MGMSFPDPKPSVVHKDNKLSQINDDYTKLVKRLMSLLPIEQKDKLGALEKTMSYVISLLYGDDLHQYCLCNYYREYVTTALDELVIYVQEHSLTEFREELEKLRKEINEYLIEKEHYLKDIDKLKKEKEQLQSDIDSLKKEKALLLDENANIKTSIDEYSAKMQRFTGNNSIRWEKVNESDPIYAVTPMTIADYISKLENAYMCKLGVTKQVCESDFILNSTGLYELKNLLLSFKDKNNLNKSISYLITNYNYLGIDSKQAKYLKTLMDNIKLPRVIEHTPILPAVNLTNSTNDLNGLLKELHYQKMVYEALAKQKIAEAQLYTLITLLKENGHNGYDLDHLLEVINAQSIQQLSNDKDGKTLISP